MTTYYLEEYDLIKVCVFNGISSHYAFIKQPLDKQKSILEDRLFNPLLLKNPKMKPFVDSFLKQYSEQSTIEQIKNFWKNKITIEDFSEPILNSNYTYREDADRLKFLKSLFDKSPNFLKIVHSHIQSVIKNKLNNTIYTNISDSIYDAYFQMLKSKTGASIKKNLSLKEIKDNIDSYKPHKPNGIKKKINAYLNSFNHDSFLYENITKELEEHINNNGTIKLFWEEKIPLFTQDVIKKHNNEKVEISWGKTTSLYLLSFQINPEFIVEKAHVTQNQALYFRGIFQNSLADFISKNFNGNVANLNGGAYYSVNILFDNQDNKNRAESFCSILQNNLDHIITTYCKKETNNNLNNQLNEYFNKLNLSFELDKTLGQKEKNQKQVKNKI